MDLKKRFEDIVVYNEIPFVELVQRKEVWNFLASLDKHIEVMKEYDQNSPYHCYDLLMHTAHVVDGIQPEGLSKEDFHDLRIAAFFHDIGKPSVRADKIIDGVKYNSFHGHPIVSEQIAQGILKRLGYKGEEYRRIRFFIIAHDLFIDFKPKEYYENPNKHRHAILPKNINRVIERTKGNYPDLHITIDDFEALTPLCEADGAAHMEIIYNADGSIKMTAKEMVNRAREVGKVIQELNRSYHEE